MQTYLRCFLLAALTFFALHANALPTFARQTGQNCMACHTGGQYPELTPYGRMFKMTGYTIGERGNPLSFMGVASVASVADTNKSDTARAGIPTTDDASDFYKNNEPLVASASLFIAGKITDNIGGFVQMTHDPYDGFGHTSADNMELRYADRLVGDGRDLIYGISLNNNPSVSDPWNTAPAWMQYVPGATPGSHQFVDGNTSYPGFASGGNIAGVSAYAYWNQTLYGEFGYYFNANSMLYLFRAGINDSDLVHLQGNNPYWRLAYTRAWDASNLMIGTTGMLATILDKGGDSNDGGAFSQARNMGIDAQYQYILDPHTVTAQVAYMQQNVNYSPNTVASGGIPSDVLNTFRAKLAATYQARYGTSISYFNTTGTSNPANVNVAGLGNASGAPDTSGVTLEVFYLPLQNARLGLQYTMYNKFNGAENNYDGMGRNASDNNTLYAYLWFAF